jgi:hypothetical protein
MDKVEGIPHIHQWFTTSAMEFGQSRCLTCGMRSQEFDAQKAELAAQKEQFRVLEDEMLVMMDERNAAVARSNLLACSLRALLSKCPDCGGTGWVGTGIIQMGQPDQMPCFVCAGERQILLKECGK